MQEEDGQESRRPGHVRGRCIRQHGPEPHGLCQGASSFAACCLDIPGYVRLHSMLHGCAHAGLGYAAATAEHIHRATRFLLMAGNNVADCRAQPSACWQRATRVGTRWPSSPSTATAQSCCCPPQSPPPWPGDDWTHCHVAEAPPWHMPCPRCDPRWPWSYARSTVLILLLPILMNDKPPREVHIPANIDVSTAIFSQAHPLMFCFVHA